MDFGYTCNLTVKVPFRLAVISIIVEADGVTVRPTTSVIDIIDDGTCS